MNKIRCIAIDDEPLALEIMAEDIGKIDFLQLDKCFNSAVAADEYLKENAIDLIFSDIRMPAVSGIQFVKNMEQSPMIIFTTAYEQYAIEGFELNVLDYLLKPIDSERLKIAADRAYELFVLKNSKLRERKFFFIYVEYQQVKIFEDEILYIEGLKDYVKIYLQNQKRPILTRLNLKNMEMLLSDKKFCRVHQSYIVALDKIKATKKHTLSIGEIIINIGEKYSNNFWEAYRC